jgi:hypothetical protein
VPRQNSGSTELHSCNNVTVFGRKLLISRSVVILARDRTTEPAPGPDFAKQLGNCLLALADWTGSEELYAAIVKKRPDTAGACALFPDFGAAHYALALIYRTLGQDEKDETATSTFRKKQGYRSSVE